MSSHEHFEKLCTFAATGEASQEELIELQAHWPQCAECRKAYSDYIVLTDEYMLAADQITDPSVTLRSTNVSQALRSRALAAVANEGLFITQEAGAGPSHRSVKVAERLNEMFWSVRMRLPKLAAVAALSAAVLVCATMVQSNLDLRREVQDTARALSQAQNIAAHLKSKLDHSAPSTVADSNPPTFEAEFETEQKHAALLDAERQLDSREINTLETKIAQLESDLESAVKNTQVKESQFGDLHTQLDQVRGDSSRKDLELAAQQSRISELSDQLAAQSVALNREQQLLAEGRDVRDLMGARNLHIIDVHDQDAQGESRPFGRIFLTEGKRLIFYAYDLDAPKTKNTSFQAWGKSSNGSKGSLSLGIFYMDDQKQSRWALTVEDPNLISAIDTVFVTIEPHGGTLKPSGKQLMYAYLRNPINHP